MEPERWVAGLGEVLAGAAMVLLVGVVVGGGAWLVLVSWWAGPTAMHYMYWVLGGTSLAAGYFIAHERGKVK
jgi:hypothetical protein